MPAMPKSKMTAQWVDDACRMNPIQLLPNGNIRTCPVRLTFAEGLLEAKQNRLNPTQEPKFETGFLVPLGVDFTPMVQEVLRVFNEKFDPRTYPRDQSGFPMGLHTPFRRQAEKAHKFEGYNPDPNAIFITTRSKFRPAVVDAGQNPIVDKARVYAGVWAIATINAYPFGISPPQPKKGVNFGLQSVMIIADDEKMGGGGSNPAEDFAGVSIMPGANIAGSFGINPAPGQGPVMGNMPVHGIPSVAGMGAPQTGAAAPLAPPPGFHQPAATDDGSSLF